MLRDFRIEVEKRTFAGTHLKGTVILQKHDGVELSTSLQEDVVGEISIPS